MSIVSPPVVSVSAVDSSAGYPISDGRILSVHC